MAVCRFCVKLTLICTHLLLLFLVVRASLHHPVYGQSYRLPQNVLNELSQSSLENIVRVQQGPVFKQSQPSLPDVVSRLGLTNGHHKPDTPNEVLKSNSRGGVFKLYSTNGFSISAPANGIFRIKFADGQFNPSSPGGFFKSRAERQKRQAFDFSMNTPAPPKTDTPSSNDESGSETGGSVGGGDSTGGDLGSFLGGLFGSSSPEYSSSAAGGTADDETDTGGLGTGTGNQPDPEKSTTEPSHGERTSGAETSTGGGLGDGGDGFGNVFGSSDAGDSEGSDTHGDSSCEGFNVCPFSNPCNNGGTCFYNTTTCTVHCSCPPLGNNHLFYDENCNIRDTPLPSTTPPTFSSTSTAGPTTTLRPFHERNCGDKICQHGYCNVNKTKGSNCTCDPGWYDWYCNKACTRNCSNGGVCGYSSTNRTEYCVCRKPWIGDNCTELPPEPPGDNKALVYWLSGSFAVGIVMLVVAGVIFMFCLWRKRLVFAMEIVYYFLPYEDNDGRQYDAFVSYVLEDADVSFVYKDLQPKLEGEMGFGLCLHQRDFVIGGAISDTILEALEDSRRFILVLSPRYLHSEWAEFEFQRAFHEMLKRKLRIIPVILEDISDTESLSPTLKTILQSVTPISYPGTMADERKVNKFWKKLKLSMPKVKGKDEKAAMTEVPAGKYTNEVSVEVPETENNSDKIHDNPASVSTDIHDTKALGNTDTDETSGVTTTSISISL